MRLFIVTGMSGAGKTVALKTMEDMGFFCVDNLPAELIVSFSMLIAKDDEKKDCALGIDIRSGNDLRELPAVFEKLTDQGIKYQILFLDAQDSVLIKRFKETRRTHPLMPKGRLEDGIQKEREELCWLKSDAQYVIDTSMLLTKELRGEIETIVSGKGQNYKNMVVTVMSFGFKYGIPEDADLVFDVRFLPNPFYEDDLKNKTGLSEEVRAYVMQGTDGTEFSEKLFSLLDFLLPRYLLEGKNQIVIAFGCTGGKHRSVTMAELCRDHIRKEEGYALNIYHRDIRR